jgi:hypothetical protein
MKKLAECVATLKDVRRSMQDDADPGIVAALDEAIAKLERCVAEDDPTAPTVTQAALGALAVLGDILACLNGVAELVKFFGA